MRRLVGLLASVALLLVGLFTIPSTSAGLGTGTAFQTDYVYDVRGHAAVISGDALERGPPAGRSSANFEDTVDRWSRGPAARANETRTGVTYHYDNFAQFVQTAPSSRIGMETGSGSVPGLAAVQCVPVAANGGRRAAPNCLTNSFTGNTLVLMADGTKKPIKDIELGDEVIATDPVTGKRGPRKVVDLIRHGGLHTMVAVRLADGTTIDATDRHPFWVESRDAWVDAIDLQPGDVVATADGDRLSVESVGVSEQDLIAYNLTVAGLHTYHVSAAEVLVHNCKWPKPTDDNCAACAREIQDMIGGDIVHVRPTGGPRMGPSANNPAGNWAEHYVVVRDGKVYDGFTGPSGMSIPDYKSQFQYADDINFGF